jgi:hypothetical protein
VSQRFDFAVDLRSLEKDLREMGSQMPVMMARALNRGGTAGKTAMARAVAKDTGIAVGAVSKEIRVDKANRLLPRVALEIQGRRIPLIAFQARGPEPSRGKGRGVSWVNQGQRKREPHAFITTAGSHRGVFIRARFTRRGFRLGKFTKREAIEQLFGPSLPKVFEKFLSLFHQVAGDAVIKTLGQEISWERSKRAGSEAA